MNLKPRTIEIGSHTANGEEQIIITRNGNWINIDHIAFPAGRANSRDPRKLLQQYGYNLKEKRWNFAGRPAGRALEALEQPANA
jgi:hypothetical protein